MFTCCKNTFPNFNITHSHFQTFIHSFLVRWLDVSAKRKQNRNKVQTCAQRGTMGGGGASKNAGGCSTFREEKLGTRDTRRRATAGGYVCIWTLREKKWPILIVIFCFFKFLLTDHPSVRVALPLPAALGLWQHCERCFKSPRVVAGGGRGNSHTQEWNISCGFVSIHTVLIC